MKLHWSPRSPFVRKVMITLHEPGHLDVVEQVRSVVAVHLPPNPAVLPDNPLGKIPTLITDEGSAVFDSRVICEYLDMRAGAGLFPPDPRARLDQLCWQALADGLTDILLLWRTEMTRPTGPWVAVTEGWQIKVRAAMARLEADATALRDGPFGIGPIRWPGAKWRDHFPALSALMASLSERPSAKVTAVVDDSAASEAEVTKGQLRFAD